MNLDNDKKLISLDYLNEIGNLLMTAGAAVAAAAAAERIDILEIALRQARSTLIEGINEFKSLQNKRGA